MVGQETTKIQFGGCLFVCDAVLLALPVQSRHGTMVWVTSPSQLKQMAAICCKPMPLPKVAANRALLSGTSCIHMGKLHLHDFSLSVSLSQEAKQWGVLIEATAFKECDFFFPTTSDYRGQKAAAAMAKRKRHRKNRTKSPN